MDTTKSEIRDLIMREIRSIDEELEHMEADGYTHLSHYSRLREKRKILAKTAHKLEMLGV